MSQGTIIKLVIALISTAGVIAAAIIGSKKAPTQPPPVENRVVAIMDTAGFHEQIYDAFTRRMGRSNIHDVIDALDDIPNLKFLPISTTQDWNKYSEVATANVIIAHASCFYDRTNAKDTLKRFDAFLDYVEQNLPRTKVVVYSKGFGDETAQLNEYVKAHPRLAGRIFTFPVPAGVPETSFRDAGVAGRLRNKVEILLN